MLPTCGPDGHPGLCTACAAEVGPAAWCDGHQDEADDALAWAAALPAHADAVATLWWIATGEVRWDGSPDQAVRDLPRSLRQELPTLGDG